MKYYDKDKPSFIQAHADSIGVLFTVIAIVTSWIWEVRAWLQRKQKSVGDDYKLSEKSFDSFRNILQIGLDAVRNSWSVLQQTD